MNQGKNVFAQLTDFLPQRVFDRMVDKYHGNKYVRFLTYWNQLPSMLFGQLSGERVCSKYYHLGFGKSITRAILAKAIENRNCKIFEELAYHMIDQARECAVTRDFELNVKTSIPIRKLYRIYHHEV